MPDSWAVFFYLGKTRLKLKQPKEAVIALRKSVGLNSNEASAYYLLGEALRSCGRATDARMAMEKSRQIRARNLETEQKAISRISGTR
jgi:Flp pilus assembly protein TadD